MDIQALIPAIDIPNEFRLSARPTPDGQVSVTWQTPEGIQPLGYFDAKGLDASLLLPLFPDWKPSPFIVAALKMFHLPQHFELTAVPHGALIHFQLEVTLPGGTTWKKHKKVNIRDWDLKQMAEVVAWVKSAQETG